MTAVTIGKRHINLDLVAWWEQRELRTGPEPTAATEPGLVLHFNGGACLALRNGDAKAAALVLEQAAEGKEYAKWANSRADEVPW